MCKLHLDVCLIMRPLHVHLGGEYPLSENITIGLCSPRRGTPLSGTGQVTADPHSGPHI